MKEAVNAFGRLDVVVNNAGYANSAPIEEMAEDDFRAQIETNLFGVVNVTRAALPVLRAQRSGVFVQFSSIGGRVGGTPGMGAYQTAKFAVEGFSEVLANEVAWVLAPAGRRAWLDPIAAAATAAGHPAELHDAGEIPGLAAPAEAPAALWLPTEASIDSHVLRVARPGSLAGWACPGPAWLGRGRDILAGSRRVVPRC